LSQELSQPKSIVPIRIFPAKKEVETRKNDSLFHKKGTLAGKNKELAPREGRIYKK
jgi:hypothetical protein